MTEKNTLYKSRIIKELYFGNNLSSSDVSSRIKTSLPVAIKMLNELIQESYITGTGYAPSTGGRRPLMYSLRPDFLFVVAVAMDQFYTRIVIMDMHRNYITPVEKFELPLSKTPGAPEMLAARINEHIRRSGIGKDEIAGIGIGMPGFVNARQGINHSFLETKAGSLAQYITTQTGIKTFLENDSCLIGLAEFKFGAARNKKNAMIINLGWGIGLGMILNGEIFKGHNGFAGEFSHIPLFSNNKLCSCGKSGCLETEVSLTEVIRKAEEGRLNGVPTALNNSLPAEDMDQASAAIMSAAEKGDKFAIEILSEAGYSIGRGVAILIHLLNPEVIVLSGRGASAGKIWQAPIQMALNEHCIPRLSANTEIVISELGYNTELIGAASLVIDNCDSFPKKKSSQMVNQVGAKAASQ